MKFTVGKKIEMTQIWRDDIAIPVTRVKVLPGVVMQIKTAATDGYHAVVIGSGDRRAKNIAKPQLGAMKGLGLFRYIKEFRAQTPVEIAELSKLSRGNQILTDTFEIGDNLKVVGTSKGKGFQGTVKRHRFHGHDTTHGTKDQVRMPGSIGAGEPQHVFKGMRMAGHMGDERVTVTNLELIGVDADNNELLIKGALPGARNSVLYITAPGELKYSDTVVAAEAKVEEVAAPVVEEVAVEVEVVAEPVEAKVEEVAAPVVEVKEVKAEVKPEEVAKAEDAVVEDHISKFAKLSAEEQEKYSSEAAQKVVSELEEKYKIDLVPVIMKLAVKEISLEQLTEYFTATAKLEAAQAEELVASIKERILN